MVNDSFRNYRAEARASVRELYRLNHRFQTVEFVRAKQAEFLPKARRVMGIWEAMEFLDTLVDDSDPDTELPQIEHLLQTAEAIRRDGHPRWFVLTGLIHDLGKVRTRSCSPSSSPTIRIRASRSIRHRAGSTSRDVDWPTS